MQYILAIIAIIADIYTILSVWGLNDIKQLWLKIVITFIVFIIGIILIILTYEGYDIKVKTYIHKDDEYWVYTKRSKYLVDGAIVSIYYKYMEYEEEHDDLVAFGYVIASNKNSNVEIKIIDIVNADMWGKLQSSNIAYKKYHIKPNVDYYRILKLVTKREEYDDVF